MSLYLKLNDIAILTLQKNTTLRLINAGCPISGSQTMGVENIFPEWGAILDFSMGWPKGFFQGGNSGKI